jgi:RimJ/RimL family protein N-acetyltransferase
MKKLGFQIEGTLRQERYIAGDWIDIVWVGLLRDEFRAAGGVKD